ncbi:ABC transporter permease subunit [Mycoplasmopsis opalescens]|uniref:ABC transporter permease subunit n=1 Tax=Mycoplasmopsis opalescens TaxID=114886 RepID=UPI0004A76400|nr:ABC transporter permease subunit [Mycoplasmopsis opalescens]
MDKNLFKLASKAKRYHGLMSLNNHALSKRYFGNWFNICLLISLALLVIIALIAYFYDFQPYKTLKFTGYYANIRGFENNELVRFDSSNQIFEEINKILEQNKQINFKKVEIAGGAAGYYLLVDKKALVKFLLNSNTTPFLGTDALGDDVFLKANNYLVQSLYIGFLLFAFELFFGIIIGSFFSKANQKLFSKAFKSFIDNIIAIPDLIWAFILFIIFYGSTLNEISIYIAIFIPGFFRIMYWAYEYGKEFYISELVKALRSIGCGEFRILFIHAIPSFFTKILVIFSRRIIYIFGFILTLRFVGITGKIANISDLLIKDYWESRTENHWQITYPSLLIISFNILFQLNVNQIHKAVEFR